MSKVTLQYQFDLFEEEESFKIQTMAIDLHTLLHRLDNDMRDHYKHDTKVDDHSRNLIERWRGMIAESGVLQL